MHNTRILTHAEARHRWYSLNTVTESELIGVAWGDSPIHATGSMTLMIGRASVSRNHDGCVRCFSAGTECLSCKIP